MYARVIAFSGADSGKREAAVEMVQGTVLPMLRTYDGYQGYIALWDEEDSRSQAIVLWESREAADAAEETLAERRTDNVAKIGLTIDSVKLLEAPIVELEGARV